MLPSWAQTVRLHLLRSALERRRHRDLRFWELENHADGKWAWARRFRSIHDVELFGGQVMILVDAKGPIL